MARHFLNCQLYTFINKIFTFPSTSHHQFEECVQKYGVTLLLMFYSKRVKIDIYDQELIKLNGCSDSFIKINK